MKQIILNIPEQQLDFFMQLIKNLGYEAELNDFNISEEDKKLVRKRIETAENDSMLTLSEVKRQLNFDK